MLLILCEGALRTTETARAVAARRIEYSIDDANVTMPDPFDSSDIAVVRGDSTGWILEEEQVTSVALDRANVVQRLAIALGQLFVGYVRTSVKGLLGKRRTRRGYCYLRKRTIVVTHGLGVPWWARGRIGSLRDGQRCRSGPPPQTPAGGFLPSAPSGRNLRA